MVPIVSLPFRRPNHARHVGAGRALVCDQPILFPEGRDPSHLPQCVLAARAGKATLSSRSVRHNQILPQATLSEGDILKLGRAWQDANIELIDKTTEIAPGITLIALVSETPGQPDKEQARILGHAALLDRISIAIKDRQPDEGESRHR